jgi:hypothetical protein
MNQKIIIAIVALVLLTGGAYFIFAKNDTSEPTDMPESSDKDTGSIVDDIKDDVFTGSLKAAVEMGIPLKCTYSVGGIEYEGLIKGEQYKGQVSMPDGKTGNVVMKENCMYTWEESADQGMKICFTEEEESMWEQTDTTGNIPGDYKCVPAVVTDSAFDLPTDVEFMDFESMMQDAGVDYTAE